jgi:hypothetical protein
MVRTGLKLYFIFFDKLSDQGSLCNYYIQNLFRTLNRQCQYVERPSGFKPTDRFKSTILRVALCLRASVAKEQPQSHQDTKFHKVPFLTHLATLTSEM